MKGSILTRFHLVIEFRLTELFKEFRSKVKSSDTEIIDEFLTHNELGLGYETICAVLVQEKIQLTARNLDEIIFIGELLDLDKDNWEGIQIIEDDIYKIPNFLKLENFDFNMISYINQKNGINNSIGVDGEGNIEEKFCGIIKYRLLVINKKVEEEVPSSKDFKIEKALIECDLNLAYRFIFNKISLLKGESLKDQIEEMDFIAQIIEFDNRKYKKI
jgi:hypothetical protein